MSKKSNVKKEVGKPKISSSKLAKIRRLNTTLLNLENAQYNLLVRIKEVENEILEIWNGSD